MPRLFASVVTVALGVLGSAHVARAQASYSVLYSFNGGRDGAGPSPVIQGTDGNFYGTTGRGGQNSAGTVFRMTSPGTVTTLYAFAAGTDGDLPFTALIQGTDGNFYGTTGRGGSASAGTVFQMTPDGTVTTLHSFTGTDGARPYAALVQATDGNFYGTTRFGGPSGYGTIFRMTPHGTVTTLHGFTGAKDDAGVGADALIQGTDGNFYGMMGGGIGCVPFGCGNVFQMTPDGTLTILHSFAGGTGGAYPNAALVQGTDGNFYGTTSAGGSPSCNCGTFFRMSADGTVTILSAFTGGPAGAYPGSALIQASDGNFYGTTLVGGSANLGTVFQMTPYGTVTTLHAFTGGTHGAYPGALVQAADGNFYGNAGGGSGSAGTVFRITLAP